MLSNHLQALLIREQLVSREQVRRAIAAADGAGISWLEQLLLTAQLDEAAVARCAGRIANVPATDLKRLAALPRDLLDLIPADLAVEYGVVPTGVDPDGVSLCMVDPLDATGVREVEFFLGQTVLREVAPATPLAWALTKYYGAACALWPRRSSARPSQRLARGSTQPPYAGEPVVLGRARHSDAALIAIHDETTDRLERRAQG